MTTYTYFYTEPTPWGYASCKSCETYVEYLRDTEWLELDETAIYDAEKLALIVRCECGVFHMNTEHYVYVPGEKWAGVYARYEVTPFKLTTEATVTKRPALTVDIIVQFGDSDILVVKRGSRTKPEEYRGCYVLPGGHVEYGETVKMAAVRELHEETGLKVEPESLQFVTIADDLNRDPMKHAVSVVYTVKLPIDYEFKLIPSDETEISAIERVSMTKLLNTTMGFDHQTILREFNLIT